MEGVVRTTRLEHLRMLRTLAADLALEPDLLLLPVHTAVLEILMRRRKGAHRKATAPWKWSTTIKYMASCQGALASLPVLRNTSEAIHLQKSPIWSSAMVAAARRARAELPRQPLPIVWAEVQRVLRTETNPATFAAVLLCWMTTSRTGCVCQLSRSDVVLHPNATLSVRFVRGKGVLCRGTAYTIHTAEVPSEFLPRFNTYLASRGSWLFPKNTTSAVIKNALRRVNTALEARSLRRGSLQHLACQPSMTDEILLHFSGHSSVKTLRRYLNWGMVAHHTRRVMANAGKALVNA
jgi:integrase